VGAARQAARDRATRRVAPTIGFARLVFGSFYETIALVTLYIEALAKLLKAVENRHSGQAKRDPESRIFKQLWIPAFAGMTAQVTFARTSMETNFLS
jgi:hypothetical protein